MPPPRLAPSQWRLIRIHGKFRARPTKGVPGRPESSPWPSGGHSCGRNLPMPGLARLAAALATVAGLAFAACPVTPAAALELTQAPAAKPEMMENCPGLV